MRKHVRILGWLHICLGIVDLLIGLTAIGVLSGIGFLSGDVTGGAIMSGLGALIAMLMGILALPNFLCGLGLLNNWGGWVIVLAVVLGVFNLAQVPFGTAIALYTFWIAWKLYSNQPEADPI